MTPTNVVKPEIAAIGVNIYTATQKYDPNGDAYNATGYTAVSGTSYAVPMVAGAVALVKQKHPGYTPAQLKSAVVNTATQDVTDAGAVARVTAVGAGKLNAGDAVNAGATLQPATISFGEIAAAALPINRTLSVTNTGRRLGNVHLVRAAAGSRRQRVAHGDARRVSRFRRASRAASRCASAGTRPRAGSYEGFIVVSGGGTTLRLPYLYLVGDNIPADVFPIHNGSFTGGVADEDWGTVLRAVDQFGVPVIGVPVRFAVTQGGGKIASATTERSASGSRARG